MPQPQGYRIASPPGSPLKARNQGQAKFATWIGTVVIGLGLFAWLIGPRLQHAIYKPVQDKITGAKTTPNPADQQFITGAAPTASPQANGILSSNVSSVFNQAQSQRSSKPQPPIGTEGAVKAGLASPAPDMRTRYAAANGYLQDAQNALNSQNGIHVPGQGNGAYLPLPGNPGLDGTTVANLTATPTPPPQPERHVAVTMPSGGLINYPSLSTPKPASDPTAGTQQRALTDSIASPGPSQSVYLPSPGGATYVGLEPGQQNGMYPQSTDTMRVAQRAAFLDGGGDSTDDIYSNVQEQAPRYSCVVYPTDPIHARLTDTINSQLPGMAYAVVTQDLRCHVPGQPTYHPIAIPAGGMFYGPYNADVQPGDDRLQGHWKVLVFPNIGYTLALKDVQGSDDEGANGLPADVNNHVGRVYTTTFIGAVLSGLANIASGGTYGLVAPTGRQLFAQGVGQSVLNTATNSVNAQQQQPPTLVVRSGTSFTIHFAQIQAFTPYNELVKIMAIKHAQQAQLGRP